MVRRLRSSVSMVPLGSLRWRRHKISPSGARRDSIGAVKSRNVGICRSPVADLGRLSYDINGVYASWRRCAKEALVVTHE